MANRQLSLLEEAQALDPTLSDEAAVVRVCNEIVSAADAEPPVKVEVIASLRGITRVERRDQPWAGMLAPAPFGSGLLITVRASDGHERQRFTICHEAGHTLFPGFHDRRQFRCNGRKTQLEQLCDRAASELLLPRRFFLPDLQKSSFGWQCVENLASRYEASIEATSNRLIDLWPGEPALFMVLQERHKPSERGREDIAGPRLRLDYCHASPGAWPYALQHKSASEDSPLHAALEGEDVAALGNVDDFFLSPIGPVEIHARRYGSGGRVLALIRPVNRHRKSRRKIMHASRT
jgi:hypothetical protein